MEAHPRSAHEIRLASFPLAQRGYSPPAVNRYLAALAEAHVAGEPLRSVPRPSFEIVTFGYDPDLVEPFLADLLGASWTAPADPSPGAASRIRRTGPAPVGQDRAGEPVESEPSAAAAPGGRSSDLRRPPSGDPEVVRLVARPTFRLVPARGYAVDEVDDFVFQMQGRVAGGERVGRLAAAAAFHVVETQSYSTQDVDRFLDTLARLDG